VEVVSVAVSVAVSLIEPSLVVGTSVVPVVPSVPVVASPPLLLLSAAVLDPPSVSVSVAAVSAVQAASASAAARGKQERAGEVRIRVGTGLCVMRRISGTATRERPGGARMDVATRPHTRRR
jgi:hypothetical protein